MGNRCNVSICRVVEKPLRQNNTTANAHGTRGPVNTGLLCPLLNAGVFFPMQVPAEEDIINCVRQLCQKKAPVVDTHKGITFSYENLSCSAMFFSVRTYSFCLKQR